MKIEISEINLLYVSCPSFSFFPVGLRVSGTILTLSESGATVQVAPGLRAAITAPHLSDVGIKQVGKGGGGIQLSYVYDALIVH